MKEILLIDLSSIFWPAWHAAAGKPVDTAYIYALDKVHSMAARHEYVAICCDSGGKNFRHDLSAEYKANRPEKDMAAIEQLRRLQAHLESEGFLLWKAEGFEADDVIASACLALSRHDTSIAIASMDKDLTQLVNDSQRISMVRPGAAEGSDAVYDCAAVKAKFGVEPSQMRDWLCLVGDASDNVKGVPGVGPKRASQLLGQFRTIGGIIAALDDPAADIAPAIRKSISENLTTIDLARGLVSLSSAVNLNFAEALEKTERTPMEAEIISVDPPVPNAGSADNSTPPQPERANTSQSIVLAKDDPAWAVALEPKTASDAMAMAKYLFASRVLQGYGNPEAIWAVILAGRSMGIDAMTAIRGMHVVEGKVTMSAQMMVALVLNSGKAEYFHVKDSTDQACTYETKRNGYPSTTSVTWTIADAERAQLGKKENSNWKKYPRNMLRWRAASDLARTVYPDVLSNIYTPEELES